MRHEVFDSDRFKVNDAASYDFTTASYDSFTERFTAPISARLVKLARLRDSARVLDIGSGTGVVAFEAAKAIGPEGRVIGIDLSEEMVKTAEVKASARGMNKQIRFIQSDAEAIEFPDASFDSVLSLFALLHFPNPQTALAQMYRVLRPGGWLAIAFGSGPPLFSLAALDHYARRVPELIGHVRGAWLTAPSFLDALAKKYLPGSDQPEESPLARSSSRKRSAAVAEMIQKAGFEGLRSSWQGHVGFLETAEEFWQLQASYSSFARKRLATASDKQVSALKQEFFFVCERVQKRKGRFAYPYAASFITARRPQSIT